jgi:transglutaminase-like putative cysteine protease
MQRTVSSHLELNISGRTDMIFSIAVARDVAVVSESLSFSLDGNPVEPRELVANHGTRLHTLIGAAGTMVIDYSATVEGLAVTASNTASTTASNTASNTASDIANSADGAAVALSVSGFDDTLDEIIYRRPSRYCESDILLPTARAEFSGLSGHELATAVTEWVASSIRYVSGSSNSSDSAVRTLIGRRGVCRDFAHLVIALLRAMDVPARMAAVYAPGLAPMDFHAVAEAYIDGQWWLLDATRLAPRQSMVRIATGRDAADIAFLSNYWANVSVKKLAVSAVASELPSDDGVTPVRLP